jgi:sulfite reductase beta subunit-like hemoprotein
MENGESLERVLVGLPSEVQEEIRRFAAEIEALEAGRRDPEDFKRFRLENGVYGIRGAPEAHMVRVKVRFGRITPEQLEALADIADRFTPNRRVHLTTRQDIQFHGVQRRDVPLVLAYIARAGLTTREACGNTVRNVTACSLAGISPTEVFDVTPYADAVSRYFLRHPIAQNLPRKFKIAFEGCREDHARVRIHDIGAVAAVEDGRRGFRLYIAGGLGAQPRAAELLEAFTPADLLIPTCEAVLRVFDRHGERRPEHTFRMRARMKFLARQWGTERLREMILAERRVLLATRSGLARYEIEEGEEEVPPAVEIPRERPAARISSPEYERWRRNNVLAQRQPGYSAVLVRCALGDVTSDALRALARIARRYCGGRMRTTITQNVLLRWVPTDVLPWVYAELAEAGLAEAHRLADVTRCPGADTCQLALTHSRGLAEAVRPVLSGDGFEEIPELGELTIKISGCMNSCGQHHIADIGFYGASSDIGGRALPQYVMLVGGYTELERVQFGRAVARIPARWAPQALARVLALYREERREGETFRQFLARVGPERFRDVLAPFQQAPPYEEAPELYRDLGAEEEPFCAEIGPGECAA